MRTDGFGNVLDQCLAVRAGEQVVLLTDEGTDHQVVARLSEEVAARDGVPLVARMPAPRLPGAEPPGAVAAMMAQAGAVIELTSLFIGSSRARQHATSLGVRYLAMPGVRFDTFRQRARWTWTSSGCAATPSGWGGPGRRPASSG